MNKMIVTSMLIYCTSRECVTSRFELFSQTIRQMASRTLSNARVLSETYTSLGDKPFIFYKY